MKLDPETIQNLEIVKYPHPVLRQEAETITEFDENLDQLVLKMIELMNGNNGVGLAAPQVGLPLRLFVANPTGNADDNMVFINIEFLDGKGWVEDEEGCLSLPQIYGKIRRRQKVSIKAQNQKGETFELEAENLLARILQHESDHLEGKMIIDRMSALSKLGNRRQIKYLEELAAS